MVIRTLKNKWKEALVIAIITGLGLGWIAPMFGVIYTIPVVKLTVMNVLLVFVGTIIGIFTAEKLKLR